MAAKQKWKIGVACYPTAGGSGVVATELGLALARRGHEVHFFSYASPVRLRAYEEQAFYHGVEVSAYPLFKYPPYDVALASCMAEVVEDAQLDLLHVHYAIPHAISAYLAIQAVPNVKTRFITTLHGTDITLVGAERAYFRITKFAIEQSHGVTAVSHYLSDETRRIFHTTKDIRVLHNFVDTETFRPRQCSGVRGRFARPDEKLLIHISNMRPVKRITDVVRMFHRVQQELPSRLLMVGDGPDRGAAEALARELGIERKLSFVGGQEDIPEFLCAADGFLLPSEFETFGLSALEAMACGVPVFITRVGGTAELINDGVEGRLIMPGDIEGAAKAMVEVFRDDKRRAAMGQAARVRAESHFALDKMVDQYEAYYAEITR